jgi:uncharacterized protein (TIRG00374 family)
VKALVRVVGVALLAFVLWQVDWQDAAHLADGSVLRGQIVGELPESWDGGATVTFRPADVPDGAARVLAAADLKTEDIRGQAVPIVNEGILRIVRRADVGWLLLGILIYGFTTHFGIARWWLLLRDQSIKISFWAAHRLTFIGFFFNNVVPGATGGDVVKAVYAARRTDKRAEAVMTVLVDRMTGIFALALIAGCVLLTRLGEPAYRELALFIFGFLGIFVVSCLLFFSRTLRRILRIDAIAARLPFSDLFQRLDQAAFLYRYKKKGLLVAVLLSFCNQLSIQLIMVLFAHALHVTTRAGEPLPIGDYMVVLPAAWMVSALPLLPGGWGLRESAFAVGFHLVGVSRNPAVALSVMGGMNMIVWSVLGGIYVILDRGAVSAATAEAQELEGEPVEAAAEPD